MARSTAMKKTILITRPNHDPTTNYLFYWSLPVIKLAQKKQVGVLDLSGTKASHKYFWSYISSRSPSLVFINGHGNEKSVTGQHNEPIITLESKTSNLVNSILYVRSCSSAEVLGAHLVTNGASCFIGYKREYIFFRNLDFDTRPLEDPIARFFLEPSNLIPTTILKGYSAGVAYTRSQKAMRRNLLKFLSSEASFEERLSVSYLWSNIRSQVLLGNSNAKM